MKATALIYIVEDMHGNQGWAVVAEACDSIQISGMKDSENKPQWFESDAYHLSTWCGEHGFNIWCSEKEYDIEQEKTNSIWKS